MISQKIVNGIIIGANGGLYDVESPASGISERCSAKGAFRMQGVSPCVGDIVNVSEEGVITEIHPRKNHIIRPPLSNLDILFFVVSSCKPSPNLLLLDKFIAVACYKNIVPVIVLTKLDLRKADEILKIYSKTVRVISIDYSDLSTLHALSALMTDKLSAFTGNSGVGKSTLINSLFEMNLKTGEISEKLGRGRHTTRQVSLFRLKQGGYIADTPGFSTFETNRYEIIRKEELAACFQDFDGFTEKCRFRDCSHTREDGCAVRKAVADGLISDSRHASFVTMYDEAGKIKDWEI